MIERITGTSIVGVCPWRGFSDPLVIAVLEANLSVGDGSPATLLIDDPPNAVWEGLVLYRAVQNRIRNHRLEQHRKEQQRHGRR